jgi:hypothetical protein
MERSAYIDDRAITRRGGGPTGFLLVLLGLWVGLVPFAGPYINYQMQTTDTWHMTSNHFWLSVLPAAALFVGGWILARGFTRAVATFGALLAFCGGVWLVIGPTFASLWHSGAIPQGGPAFGSNGVRVAEWLGFYYAAGALAILLATYAFGYLSALPILARRVTTAAAPAPAPMVRGPAATTAGNGDADSEAAPRRRRFLRNPLTRA